MMSSVYEVAWIILSLYGTVCSRVPELLFFILSQTSCSCDLLFLRFFNNDEGPSYCPFLVANITELADSRESSSCTAGLPHVGRTDRFVKNRLMVLFRLVMCRT